MEVNPALNADAIVDVPNGDDPTIEANSSHTNFNALQVRIHLYTCTVRWLCAGFFSIVQLSDRLHMIFVQGNVNEITIPMLPSTVTESPSTLLATISVQELLKPVAQAAEVWDVSLFDSHEKNRIMDSVLRNFMPCSAD